MTYVLASVEVPDQERLYYAGPKREILDRKAYKVTHLLNHATSFNTREEAETMCRQLGDGYYVMAVED